MLQENATEKTYANYRSDEVDHLPELFGQIRKDIECLFTEFFFDEKVSWMIRDVYEISPSKLITVIRTMGQLAENNLRVFFHDQIDRDVERVLNSFKDLNQLWDKHFILGLFYLSQDLDHNYKVKIVKQRMVESMDFVPHLKYSFKKLLRELGVPSKRPPREIKEILKEAGEFKLCDEVKFEI